VINRAFALDLSADESFLRFLSRSGWKNLQPLAFPAVAIINIWCHKKIDTQAHSAYTFIENDDK